MDRLLVFSANSAKTLVEDLFMVPAIEQASADCDMVIFAVFPELIGVQDLFKKSPDKEHHYDMQVVRTIVQQAVPRPELKFFTMETVCGAGEKSLEEGEIIVPAVTVGPLGGSETKTFPKKEMFMSSGMYFYQGIQDNFERVIPGYKGFEGTSVIMPGTFLGGIFEKLMLGLKKNGGKVLGVNSGFVLME
ncbi:hypothetical protein TrCOL_g6566 [Triparma columacea]|uniref:Uncharacterized protein n=1 Tax=Triparma columacea TaxID=722753 RepID=A0A9W7LCX0_9STRA|nr:hypothetical protein TrCOL_g6566 [Triparma columacea]